MGVKKVAKKSIQKRISEKKEELKKVQDRISLDKKKVETLENDLRELETEQVFTILETHHVSVSELNQILQRNNHQNN